MKGCNWNNVKSMSQYIHLARSYPDDIVGIDFYGREDDCRMYWQDFYKYTKILHCHHIRCQATMNNYKDLQLIDDVIKGLNIDRVCEAYEIILSTEQMENILIKHGIHLVLCPISNTYTIINEQMNKKQKYQSSSSSDNFNEKKESNETISYSLMNYLQSEMINYSITSFSPIEYQQNLSTIYKNLFQNNPNTFTCEHVNFYGYN